MAVERTSVEIWQMILRYAISVPVFFEANPVETCGYQQFIESYNNTRLYWRAERSKNALRRVCASWNAYLKRYDHRYVNLMDVKHGHVPTVALPRAIRIEISDTSGLAFGHSDAEIDILFPDLPGPWSLEILEGNPISRFSDRILESGKAPLLKSILKAYSITWEEIIHLNPNTLVLSSPTKNLSQRYELLGLTTLWLRVNAVDELFNCSFPSLEHLSLFVQDGGWGGPHDLIRLLQLHGRRLISFIDCSWFRPEKLPDEIWELCPGLERFGSSFSWPANLRIPSTLKLLHLSESLLFSRQKYMIPGAPLYDAGVIIRWNREWGALLWRAHVVMKYVVYAIDHGLSMQDASGITFQEFIVAILLYRKHSHIGPSRNLKGVLRSSMILDNPPTRMMHILFARWLYPRDHQCIRLWV
jgi:hypothetical protein